MVKRGGGEEGIGEEENAALLGNATELSLLKKQKNYNAVTSFIYLMPAHDLKAWTSSILLL